MSKICKNCGTELKENDKFCHECGNPIESITQNNNTQTNNNKIIIISIVIFVVILLIFGMFIGDGYLITGIHMEEEDFGGITMLTPVDSGFVEVNSNQSHDSTGGFAQFENIGDYSKDVFSIMFSSMDTPSIPDYVVYDHDNGDIRVYKDKNDEDELYMIKEVDGIHVSLIGNNEEVMAKMLNSAKLTTTFAY
ncbi:MAG: zinc ribbon domain-containing protein [Methanobrevibacter sp.]|nr:zinc ribbon domain-containing protein [Methanobrevibacter sp.]